MHVSVAITTFLIISTVNAYYLDTNLSLFVWNTSSPTFTVFGKNRFGRLVPEDWVTVDYQTISSKIVACTIEAQSIPLGTEWSVTESYNKKVFSKIVNGANVTFVFQTFDENTTIPVYGGMVQYPIVAGVLKTTIYINNWNYPLLGDCLNLNFAFKTSKPVTQTLTSLLSSLLNPLLDPLLSVLIIVTDTYKFRVNSLRYAKSDNLIVTLLGAVLNTVSGLLDTLLGQNGGLFYYRFPKSSKLEYDPDYSVITTLDPSCNTLNDCSGHGTCVSNQECQCNARWKGADCSIADCPGTPDCSGNGNCYTTSGTPVCTCTVPGWTGADCATPICPGLSSPCSNHGRCITSAGSTPTCDCSPGWTGNDCSIADCPGTPDCSNNGKCNDTVSIPFCNCFNGWLGETCNIANCPGEPDCNDNGRCDTRVSPPSCICKEGWGGADCFEEFRCFNSSTCNHGACNDTNGLCSCDEGWIGSDCLIAICPGYDVNGGANCFSKGTCNSLVTPHVCDCFNGWEGPECSIPLCPGKNCSGHGDCITSSTVPSCSCTYGWEGLDCSIEKPKPIEDNEEQGSINESANGFTSNKVAFGAVIAIGCCLFITLILFIAVEIYRRKEKNIERNLFRRASEIYKRQSTMGTYDTTNPYYAETKSPLPI